MVLDAYAKINLALDVIGKRNDGYHELRMIMQQVNLKDKITIKERKKDIVIKCDNPLVPTDESNLVYKAYEILKNKFNIDKGIYIEIEKNIPVAAGLAGGSSNAAAVLKGLNKIWNLNLTDKELMDIAVNIGADVPYCIMGKTALAEGIGERLTKLPSFSDKLILLTKPNIEVSTAYVYKNLNFKEIDKRPDVFSIIEAMNNNDLNFVANNMINVLENVTTKEYSIINEIKQTMVKYNALGSLMSGSGPTVFGIFDNEKDIKECRDKLKEKFKEVFIAKTL
ncbi:MAG: 4-(cytidine 5'-diphospho)-2-C-methyl-D-erythritol kinase [Firmicutes bacterium]|nr:4-(cytidine 5'-diphospho)-2-C-methyl-D-erythritol kinase [Bacillota bacterium]